MEFWEPKLPTIPILRLTWLTTADMNRLAPLKYAGPKLQYSCLFRFKGLNHLFINPSKFIYSDRDGFTLVEWGGFCYISTVCKN